MRYAARVGDLQMASATVALQAIPTHLESFTETFAESIPDSFRVEDLYELQERRGKMKPPVISYEQLNSMKQKFGRLEGFDCAFVRAVHSVFSEFGSISSWMCWNPLDGVNTSLQMLKYSLFGSSRVDNIVSGRARMTRLRPTYTKNSREMLQVE